MASVFAANEFARIQKEVNDMMDDSKTSKIVINIYSDFLRQLMDLFFMENHELMKAEQTHALQRINVLSEVLFPSVMPRMAAMQEELEALSYGQYKYKAQTIPIDWIAWYLFMYDIDMWYAPIWNLLLSGKPYRTNLRDYKLEDAHTDIKNVPQAFRDKYPNYFTKMQLGITRQLMVRLQSEQQQQQQPKPSAVVAVAPPSLLPPGQLPAQGSSNPLQIQLKMGGRQIRLK